MFPSTWHQAKTFSHVCQWTQPAMPIKKNSKTKQEKELIPLHTCLLPFLCGVIDTFLSHDIWAPSQTTTSSAFLGSLLHNLPLTRQPINSDLIKDYFLYVNDQLYFYCWFINHLSFIRVTLCLLCSLKSFIPSVWSSRTTLFVLNYDVLLSLSYCIFKWKD